MTSIEWLINELVKADRILDGHRKSADSTVLKLNPTKIFEQAKAMHAQELEDSRLQGYGEGYHEGLYDSEYK